MQYSTLLIYLAVRNKKKETDFYIKLLLSFRERFQNALRAHIQKSNTAMEWSHSFRSIWTACANFSERLTENWGCKPTNGIDYPWGTWKNTLLLYMELWAPGSWQVRFPTHTKDSLIRKIVQLRDYLNFLQHFWSLQFHKPELGCRFFKSCCWNCV